MSSGGKKNDLDDVQPCDERDIKRAKSIFESLEYIWNTTKDRNVITNLMKIRDETIKKLEDCGCGVSADFFGKGMSINCKDAFEGGSSVRVPTIRQRLPHEVMPLRGQASPDGVSNVDRTGVILFSPGSEILIGGKGDGVRPEDVNSEELKTGIRIEREHINIPNKPELSGYISEEIALDHIAEASEGIGKIHEDSMGDIVKYYGHLTLMEESQKLQRRLVIAGRKEEAIQFGKAIREDIRKKIEAKRREMKGAR